MKPAMILAAAAAFVSMAVVFVVKTFADAVFLAEYGIEYVPHFFVAQAAVLITTSWAYGAALRRSTVVLDVVILAILAASSFAVPFVVALGDASVFIVALALVALATLAQMAVWNAVTSIVSGRRSRSFLPKAGAAATAGAVVGGFGSSGIISLGGVSALAVVAGVLTLGTLAMRVMLIRKSHHPPAASSATKSIDANPEARGASLIRFLAIGVIVESVLSAMIDYGFKREVTQAFIGGDRLGLFFSFYYGSTNTLLLLLQLLATSRLLATRSLRFTLSIQPFGLVAMALAWAAFPLVAVAVATRGFETVLKFGVARPGQEVALTPLPELERKRLKVLLRGVYAQGGAAAAGGFLVIAAPFLDVHAAIVPAICGGLAVLWLAVSRRTAAQYLTTLGSALGLRRMSEGDERRLDRDGMQKLLDLVADDDDQVSGLGRELLNEFCEDTAGLASFIGTGTERTRTAVYELLAQRPNRRAIGRLRAAVKDESGPSLVVLLDALAAHGDASQTERAEAILASEDSPAPLSAAAWAYLCQAGSLDADPERHRRGLRFLLSQPGGGARVGALYRGAVERKVIDGKDADDAILSALADAEDTVARVSILTAGAVLGRQAPLRAVLNVLAERSGLAEQIVPHVDGPSLLRLYNLAQEDGTGPAARRLLVALRSSDLPVATEIASRALTHDNTRIRELAAHTLLAQRGGTDGLPHDAVEAALSDQMSRFELYVRARPGMASVVRESLMEVRHRHSVGDGLSREVFFLDELERATERSLRRLCDLLALLGNPGSVFAAERGLRAPTFKRRRQAVDVLQEVTHGRDKTRLLELLDLYLMPKGDPPDDARDRVCELDPWLARCASDLDESATIRLWALRSALIFDAVPGEYVAELADRVDELEFKEGSLIVSKGDPADDFYVVLSGVITVERNGRVVAELGPGEPFGELSLIDRNPRNATVRARSQTTLLRLPGDSFDAALEQTPEIGIGLVLGLVKLLREDTAATVNVRQTMT